MPPLMRVERAFPLRWPLSLEHGFGRFLARRQVAGGDWALVQLYEITGGAFLLKRHCQWQMISLLLVVDRHKLTVFYLKSFDMDSVQVGKAVFGKEIHTTLGIEPRTILQSGEVRQPF